MPATKAAFKSQPSPVALIPVFLAAAEGEELERALYEKTRQRAVALFEESGRAEGNDDANWLQAESQVLHAPLELRESATWVSLQSSLPDADPRAVEIFVRPTRVVVRLHRLNTPDVASDEAGSLFLAANLPATVDPSSAAASFRDQTLRLIVRKSEPDALSPK
jgi:HSP20 family molecular chaperone IbpA